MDTLANLLTKVRNAYAVAKEEITAPVSKSNLAVLKVLVREGYLSSVTIEPGTEEAREHLKIVLKYDHRTPVVGRIRRLSKPGRRVYASVSQIPRPKGGYGTIILSTPEGILADRDAKKLGIGGELICEVIRGEGL
ncbi:MAG: 30S ribosomal protein S8 [Patescibacteria group bacterium]